MREMKRAIFEIFRTGKHNGTGKNAGRNWTEEELQKIALYYAQSVRNAPLVIGHPTSNAPELGKVHRLIYCKNALFAESSVNDELIGKIKAGKIKGISASFLTPEQDKNPAKGVSYYLNHVGFLENQNPAVKNMLPPEISIETLYFNDSTEIIYFEEDSALKFAENLNEKAQFLAIATGESYATALHILTH